MIPGNKKLIFVKHPKQSEFLNIFAHIILNSHYLTKQMKKDQINSKILKSTYIPTAEFYSQIIDSLQDYSILTLDNEFVINSWSSGAEKILHNF